MKSAGSIIFLFLMVGCAFAESRSASQKREVFFELMASASALQLKCPEWQMDNLHIGLMMMEAGVGRDELETKYLRPFMAQVAKASKQTEFISGPSACEIIRKSFGPNGEVAPNFMVRRRN